MFRKTIVTIEKLNQLREIQLRTSTSLKMELLSHLERTALSLSLHMILRHKNFEKTQKKIELPQISVDRKPPLIHLFNIIYDLT